MKKLLLFLLLITSWFGSQAQTGAKRDFIRTPNGFNTIVDWNLKAKSFNLPHYLLTSRPLTQDSIGTIFLNTNSSDPHIYIKNLVGSVYNPLAFISDIPNTFTSNFQGSGTSISPRDLANNITIQQVTTSFGGFSSGTFANTGDNHYRVIRNLGAINVEARFGITAVTAAGGWYLSAFQGVDTAHSKAVAMRMDKSYPEYTRLSGTERHRIAVIDNCVGCTLDTASFTLTIPSVGPVVNSIFGRNGSVVAQSGDYNTSLVTESGNLYFTQARVLATPVTGYSPSAGVISATDQLITVINKLQGNITAATTGVATFNGRTGTVTLTTADVNAVLPTTLGTVTAGAVPYSLLTGTVPTWNQNTTGSAATLTTPRAINSVNFDGSAPITLTANTPNSLLNGWGILGGSFNGGSAITLRVDTSSGKVATTTALIDTINAHGATAGYGINSTLFGAGTVAVDTINVGSKAWGFASFYTKAQTAANFASLATANTFNATALATTTTPWLTVGTNTAATSGATSQYSGLTSNIGYAWNPTAAASQSIQMGWEVEPISANPVIANYVLRSSTNGAGYVTNFYVTNTGQVTIPQLAVFNQGFFGGTSTDVQVITNAQTASGTTTIVKSGRVRYGGGVWNPNTSAANYAGFTTEVGGVSTTAPGGDFDIYGYFGTSSTPTFTKLSSLDAATGNLTLQTGTLIEKGTSAAINSTATATAAQVAGGVLTSTSAAATTITLPTATAMATQLNITGFGRFTFAVYNTSGANTVTIALGSGMTALTTLTGENTLTIPSGTGGFGRFALEFSNATTCTISRIE
jgi:hypothetical protein